jgi:hypothetical protein
MHTHIELRGRAMMKTKKNSSDQHSSGCLFFHVHESTLMKFPEKPNTKQWHNWEEKMVSKSISCCLPPTEKPTKAPNWNNQNLPTESTFTQLKRLKKSVDFFSLKITESTNHPNKKSVNFLSPWNLWKHNQSPNWKNCELFVSLNSLKAQSITQLKKLWTLFCCFWVAKVRAQVSSVGCSSSFKAFYLVVNLKFESF